MPSLNNAKEKERETNNKKKGELTIYVTTVVRDLTNLKNVDDS
jgi:hypothetical protein